MPVKPVWTIKTRTVDPATDDVMALNLHVEYLGRGCDLRIFLTQPLRGQTPENEVVLREIRRLRDALSEIVDEPSQ